MTRRCFLHVGVPKTGTTYLQSVMWSSRGALADQGVRLPLARIRDHFWITLALRGRLDPELDPPAAHDVLDRLAAWLAEPHEDDLLISHELLSPVGAEGIARLRGMLQGFEVHVVVTARDLYRQVPAEWQQYVKTRSTLTYPEFLAWARGPKSRHFWAAQDVADVAARWSTGLSPEQVHIVTVPPAGSPPGLLLERFCSVLGIDPATLDTDVTRTNPSLGATQVELLRRVNASLGDRLPHPRAGYSSVVKHWFAEQVLAEQPGARLGLPPGELDWWEERSRTLAAQLRDARYDVVGDVEDLLPPRPDASEEVPAPSDAELVAVAVDAFAALLDLRHREVVERRAKMARMRREIDDLRAQLDAAPRPPLARLKDKIGARRRG